MLRFFSQRVEHLFFKMSYQDLLKKLNQLEGERHQEFISKLQDWALLHGLSMRSRTNFDQLLVTTAPFTVLPSPVQRTSFEKVLNVQTVLNKLFHKLAYDSDFLDLALSKTVEHDDFTRRLYDIYTTVKKEGYSQPLSLGLLRSDYLPDANGFFKLVEMNTVASSMSGLIAQVELLHRFVLAQLECEDHLEKLPENNSLTDLSAGLIAAWKLYGNKRSVVLFLVEEATYNIADQRLMEFEISRQNSQVRVVRRTILQLVNEAKLGPKNELLIGDLEVAVAYFRTCYDPGQFANEDCWSMRLLIERSKAIKCPSIQYHLVGTKKVQQVLSEPGVLQKYLADEKLVSLVMELFVDIYSLDETPEGDRGFKLALSEPEDFVLKPQREGGGHNIYGTDISAFLKGISRDEASAYILMRLIKPEPALNTIVRLQSVKSTEIVSEFGVYGVIIGDGEKIVHNSTAGHMLRSKDATAREVGVAAGFGALDSPYLT